jgi:hypothetical protein
MNPDRQQAVEYLRVPPDGLWRWSENGAVLVWHDGSTIAFREEIVQIIEWLAPNGLPSFGAIVFLLAACRARVPGVSDIITISDTPLPAAAGKDAALLLSARDQLKAQLHSALSQLEKVSRLPGELNSGIKAKCILAEAVFEPAKVERYVEARAVLRGMRESMTDSELTEDGPAALRGSYIRQIHIVAQGLKLITPESLTLRQRTGLDSLPKESDANLPTAERARRLIEELSRDREYGPVGRAARELMAAVRLPRRLGERENLAIGGLADITNRGPLDRLLLSELAHDDLTLSVRVALNEALYLRREPPMREPPGTLALLLDSGIRLWGVPRVLATSIALAMIARDKQHSEVLVWRAHGKELEAVDLLSRKGLTDHLGSLEPRAHAGESLPAFAQASKSGPQNQSVLITHPDALGDPEFRRALSGSHDAPGFVATVERDGRFELHAMPLAHRPPLCAADLDLASIFDGKTAGRTLNTELDPNLPAIFRMSPFPFLLPIAGKVDYWIKEANGRAFAVLNDRRLVQYGDQKSGARVLASDLPGGKTIWMDCDGLEVHAVKSGSRQRPARLVSVPLANGQMRVTDLAVGSEVQSAYRYGEAILLIRSHDIRAHSLGDGRLLDSARNPHRWIGGRFFRGTSHFYFATWNGTRVSCEPVTIPSRFLASSISLVFDRRGLTGPWALLRSGQLVSTDTGEAVKLPNPASTELDFNYPGVSKDGARLFVPRKRKSATSNSLGCLFGLQQESAAEFLGPANSLVDAGPPMPTWNIYRIVEAIAALPEGLALCGRKQVWRKLALDPGGKLRITLTSAPGADLLPQAFTGQFRKTKHGCSLQELELASGSKIFLDTRGLLHLKSFDPDLPEVSLVLADGEIAGWTSDGHVCGPSFFFDGSQVSEPESVFERIMKFFARS